LLKDIEPWQSTAPEQLQQEQEPLQNEMMFPSCSNHMLNGAFFSRQFMPTRTKASLWSVSCRNNNLRQHMQVANTPIQGVLNLQGLTLSQAYLGAPPGRAEAWARRGK